MIFSAQLPQWGFRNSFAPLAAFWLLICNPGQRTLICSKYHGLSQAHAKRLSGKCTWSIHRFEELGKLPIHAVRLLPFRWRRRSWYRPRGWPHGPDRPANRVASGLVALGYIVSATSPTVYWLANACTQWRGSDLGGQELALRPARWTVSCSDGGCRRSVGVRD